MKTRMQQRRLSKFVMRKTVEYRRRVTAMQSLLAGEVTMRGDLAQHCGDPYCGDCALPETRH